MKMTLREKITKGVLLLLVILIASVFMIACEETDNMDMTGGNEDNGNQQVGINVTFMDGDDMIHTATSIGDILNYTPTKVGKTFVGWYFDSALTIAAAAEEIKNDSILYAKWEDAKYTVRFVNYNGTVIQVNGQDVQTVVHGQSATAPEAPTREGYEFKGWTTSFDVVTSNLIVRPIFGNVTQKITLYGEDNTVIEEVRVDTGADITSLYNSLMDRAEQSVPGGLAFETLCTDIERKNPYQVPSGEHVMPSEDLNLYTRVVMQEIEGLTLTESRNDFRYDLQGFSLSGDLYYNNIITYAFEWYDVTENKVIEGETGTTVDIECKDVGEYIYELRVTATYKDLEPCSASVTKTINVLLGTLEGMISVKGLSSENGDGVYNTAYNATVRTLNFDGTLEGDVISYKNNNDKEAFYSTASPMLNAGNYKIATKIERKNYEPLELEPVNVVIDKLTLFVDTSLSLEGQTGEEYYQIEYGEEVPAINYVITGFAQGESEANLTLPQGMVIYNQGYQVGSPVLEDGEFYEMGVRLNSWTSVNYIFDENSVVTQKLRVVKRVLVINVQPYEITYGDNAPNTGVYTITFGSIDGSGKEIGLPFSDSDKSSILETVKFQCSYVKGNPVAEYEIKAGFEETEEYKAVDSYNVTINNSILTVNKKAVTVTPNALKVTYGDQIPTYTFKATGLVNNDKLADLVKGEGTVPTAICGYRFKASVGTYEISIDENSLQNGNYRIPNNAS